MSRLGTAIGVAVWVMACGGSRRAPDAEELYRSRHWFALGASIDEQAPPLIRGAVAAAFNDSTAAERLLATVAHGTSRQTAADDAYALLSDLYLRSGQYRRLAETITEWAAAFPDSEAMRQQRENVDRFGDRPDQINPEPHHVVLHHDDDSFSLPAIVNGRSADYLFDTGASHSVVTEPRARALGLAVGERTHTLTGSSGLTTTFRTAVASKVVIGEMTFKNVSFAVVTGGPYADIDAGVIGLPIVMALRTVTWSRDGTVDVGGPSAPSSPSERNLAFDGGRLLLKASVHGKVVSMTLDTGASDSDLNANFADMFPQIAAAGKKGTREIAGAGGPRTFESIEIPEVVFDIAGHHVGVRPAHVAMQRIATIGGQCCIGNAGHDLLVQQQTFRLDFGAMRLTLR